jgi:hypothetical protein
MKRRHTRRWRRGFELELRGGWRYDGGRWRRCSLGFFCLGQRLIEHLRLDQVVFLLGDDKGGFDFLRGLSPHEGIHEPSPLDTRVVYAIRAVIFEAKVGNFLLRNSQPPGNRLRIVLLELSLFGLFHTGRFDDGGGRGWVCRGVAGLVCGFQDGR